MSKPKPERVRQILEEFTSKFTDVQILKILDPAKFQERTWKGRYGERIFMCNFGFPCIRRPTPTLVGHTFAIGSYGLDHHAVDCNLLPYQFSFKQEGRDWSEDGFTHEGKRVALENLLYYINPIYHQLYLQILDEAELRKL